MSITTTNQARIDFRTTSETKSLVEQAAALQGMTVSEFAKSILIERSREILAYHEMRVLSDRDRDIFLDLLDAPPAPNAALRAAAAEFRGVGADGVVAP